MKPNLAADLFALGASTMQDQLAEAYEGVPRFEPTPEDLNRMAAIEDEKRTEGRVKCPPRQNPHD